jgi:hypothetical protein
MRNLEPAMRKKHDPKLPADPIPKQGAQDVPAKRSRFRAATASEKESREANLLVAVDASQLEAAARQARIDAQQIKATGIIEKTDLTYPDIVAEGVLRKLGSAKRGAAPKAETPSRLPLASSNLLHQLRLQAKSLQDQQDWEQQQFAIIEDELGHTLYQVFVYLHDLAQQLNVIKPTISRSYLISEGYEFQNPVWQRGFVDYRALPQSSGNTVGVVSFIYHLAAKEALTIERDGGVADSFRQRLFDFNLNVNVKESRLENYFLERACFTIAPEIKTNIHWEMDPHHNLLVIQTHNLEHLGFNRYILPPEKVTPALLDELGRTILGQSHRFSSLVYR